jgi:hypothetical protein
MSEQPTTQQKLNLETASIEWKDLQLFFAQGKLLVVEPSSDLVKVASLIADNKFKELESLIEQQKIEFVTPKWVKLNCQQDTLLWAVVVSPYVVCQLNQSSD